MAFKFSAAHAFVALMTLMQLAFADDRELATKTCTKYSYNYKYGNSYCSTYSYYNSSSSGGYSIADRIVNFIIGSSIIGCLCIFCWPCLIICCCFKCIDVIPVIGWVWSIVDCMLCCFCNCCSIRGLALMFGI